MDDSLFTPRQPSFDPSAVVKLASRATLVENPDSNTDDRNKRGHEELNDLSIRLCRPNSLLYLLSKGKSCSLSGSFNVDTGVVKRELSEKSKKHFIIESPVSMEMKSQNTNQGNQYVYFVPGLLKTAL